MIAASSSSSSCEEESLPRLIADVAARDLLQEPLPTRDRRQRQRRLMRSFALDVAVVALRLRPCLLNDRFFINDIAALQSFVINMRRLTDDQSFGALIMADQTFFIRRDALLHSLDRCLTSTIFVDASARSSTPGPCDISLRNEARQNITDLIALLRDSPRSDPVQSFTPSRNGLVPAMCGCLLEYPAVYVLDADSGASNCLADTPLMLVRASARVVDQSRGNDDRASHQDTHLLMSFSVPVGMYDEGMRPTELARRLESNVDARSVFAGIEISSTVISLPAVAL